MARQSCSDNQAPLPGTPAVQTAPPRSGASKTRIPLLQLLEDLQVPEEGISSLTEIYRNRVLPGKTRSIQLLGRKSPARIIETLLGYEVKAWYKRIQCPDMVTARYLKLFTEIGCRVIRIPYDPTLTAELLPGLEGAMNRIREGVESRFPEDRERQLYLTRELYRRLRAQLLRASRQQA